jgi:RNA methyltransferase, TrmH family
MNFKAEKISSKQNPGIKNLLHLQKHSERESQALFIIEGIKEIEKAILSSYTIDSLYYCPEIAESEKVAQLFKSKIPKLVFEISREIFNKIAYRQDSGGILVLAKPKIHNFENLKPDENPLILVIEGIEKPGNIGAIYRTADAAGISGIVICDGGTDIYNPNAIRASLGCIFTIPTVVCSSLSAIEWLRNHKIQILTSYLKAAVPYYKVDYTKPSAIVMGTEATGISDIWVKASDTNIIIPMKGIADSMNVSTATAVLVFEACRQREFK